jgi:signal transduction histidine kinase
VWRDGQWRTDGETYPWSASDSITHLVERHSGGLAIGTVNKGLYLYFRDGRVLNFDYRNSSIQNWARVVYEDREGNLWVGSGSGGLTVVRTTGLGVLNPEDKFQGRAALAIAEGRDRSLWIGTEGAGLYRVKEGRWTHLGTEQGLRSLYIWALGPDPAGDMLAGTWSTGVFRVDGQRLTVAPAGPPISAPVLALQPAMPDGAEWIGTGAGLLRVKGDDATWLREPGKTDTFVSAIEVDGRGVIWLALPDRGLGRVDGGKLTIFGRREGLSSDSAQCLLADGDALWIGTRDGGLNLLHKGRFSVVDKTRGLVSNVICHIADDRLGFLWISTHHGIMRISKEELQRCAEGVRGRITGRVFDRSDGLPTLEFSGGLQASGCRTADGRLWFTSSKGVLGVDPAAVGTNRSPPPLLIEALTVDGRIAATSGIRNPGPLRLSPAHHRLDFQYTALTLTGSTKVQFRHRLAGVDRDWIDAGAKRTAAYSQLTPGRYRFEVIACSDDGIWSPVGASLSFTVLPFYWQTWWFRLAAAALAVALVAGIVRSLTRRRMQRRVRELEFERGIERERARIAQDIHDDIGSNLTRISMLSQSLQLDERASPHASALIERIRGAALEVTTALDEIVWAVNPQHDSLDGVVSYLAKYTQETVSAAGIRCRLDLPVNLPPWTLNTQTRHNLVLAFKEALNNAVKHAGATEVKLALRLSRREFTVLLEDNGRGGVPPVEAPAPARATRGGNGLGNMRRRLEQIGGRCEIDSQTGRGTRIAFVVSRGHPGPDAS